ncbi:MAG: hypothetical protein ACYTAN_07830, partial [Planctomycetota bacterium]
IFATADGTEISGYVYLSGGGRARNVTVEVSAPSGEHIASLETDEEGRFSFSAKLRCDHILKVTTADGHAASWTVPAAELPESLPLPERATSSPEAETEASEGPDKISVTAAPIADGDASLSAEMASLRKQVIAMREQLDGFQEKRTVQDIIGAVGYILGVAGVAFYILGRRRNSRKSDSGKDH